jgi:hypothetical protein
MTLKLCRRKCKSCYLQVLLGLVLLGCVPNTQFSNSNDPDWAKKILRPSEAQLKSVCDLGFDSKKLYKAGSIQIEKTEGTFRFQSVLGYWYQKCAEAGLKNLAKPRPFASVDSAVRPDFEPISFRFREFAGEAETQVQLLNGGSVTTSSVLINRTTISNMNLNFYLAFPSEEFIGDEIRFYIGIPSGKIFLSIRRSEYNMLGEPLTLRQ